MPTRLKSIKARVAAFLDLGANSVRLLVVRFNANGGYSVLSQQKEVVRLAAGEFQVHVLQPAAVEHTLYICRNFAAIARALGASDIIAVATSAVREASNQADFLRRFRKATHLELHVISGREEARLIYLGVSRAVNLGRTKALFIDIGGGSTELIVGSQSNFLYLDSLKLGAIRMSERFLKSGGTGTVSTARYRLIQEHVRNVSVRALQHVRHQRPTLMIGSSGTIMNLGDIACRRFLKRRLKPNDVIPLAQLQKVILSLRELPVEERRQIPGINPDRADIIIGGAAVLETIMQATGLKALQVSDRSLRDGLLVDYLARHRHDRRMEAISVRYRSVLQLGRICNFDEVHARRVQALAVSIYNALARLRLHSFGQWERELLEYAALLHDIGLFLSFTNHHAHSYYLVRNADLIGFDQREIDIMAAMVFFHRKMLPRHKHPEFEDLDYKAKAVVRVLCVCLKMAESLNRGHDGNIRQVYLRRMPGNQIKMMLQARHDCRFELLALSTHQRAFETVFRRRLLNVTRKLPRGRQLPRANCGHARPS